MNSKNINDGLNLFEKGKAFFKEAKDFVDSMVPESKQESKTQTKNTSNESTIIINGVNYSGNNNETVFIDGIQIEFKNLSKSIEVHVASNSIKSIKTTNGNVVLTGSNKIEKITTTNGHVEVKEGNIGTVRTTNGSIKM